MSLSLLALRGACSRTVSLLGQGARQFRWGHRNLGIVSLTRYIGPCPGRHLPDYKLQTSSSKSRRLFLFFHSYILYYDLHFNISRQPVSGLSSSSINPRQCKGGSKARR